MRKFIIILLLLFPVNAYAQGFGVLFSDKSGSIRVDTSKFGGLANNEFLTASDKTVQVALDTLNFLPASNLNVVGDWSFANGRLGLPQGTSCAASCGEGDICYDTNATTGQRIYACESSVWTLQGDAGGAGSPWQTTLNVTELITSTDTVTVGSATVLAKLAVDGDAY